MQENRINFLQFNPLYRHGRCIVAIVPSQPTAGEKSCLDDVRIVAMKDFSTHATEETRSTVRRADTTSLKIKVPASCIHLVPKVLTAALLDGNMTTAITGFGMGSTTAGRHQTNHGERQCAHDAPMVSTKAPSSSSRKSAWHADTTSTRRMRSMNSISTKNYDNKDEMAAPYAFAPRKRDCGEGDHATP